MSDDAPITSSSAGVHVKNQAVLLVLGVFLLGMVCGSGLLYLGQRSLAPHRVPPPPLARGGGPFGGPYRGGGNSNAALTRQLNLDAAQQQQVNAIVTRYRQQLSGMVDQMRKDIRAVLRPDQQAILDQMRGPDFYLGGPPRRGGFGRRGPGGRPPGGPPPNSIPPGGR